MDVKSLVIFCASALFVKTISGQYINQFGPAPFGPGLYNPGRFEPLGAPYGAGLPCNGVSSTGGNFVVTSVSPIAPTGLTVVSENVIEGKLGAGGQLPFLGTVALEGAFPTAGVGAISYGCGTGAVAITSEGPIATGILSTGLYGAGMAGPVGPGLGMSPLGGCGCAL